ncbi:hypothetical protein H696_03361 [Fonticula alba]|uniref:Asteroid domain-containing protein n=1 Tax=Fonticula alba TaxID=691883 RepID=A0A058Z6I5_FONAL|nr:hypothetical protein H696_03361 [Fonticula alba]KCV69894.1 hypothetical protein H696_03361 [Fonticula alba]|eukprot:XP_009495500.1 hypothetical protein H696_03361 [Fonticula alba]
MGIYKLQTLLSQYQYAMRESLRAPAGEGGAGPEGPRPGPGPDPGPSDIKYSNYRFFHIPEDVSILVLPVDLSNFLYEMVLSTFLFVGQRRSIGYDSALVVPFLDALVEWLSQRKCYAVFVTDGLKPSRKVVTTKDRKEKKSKILNVRLTQYLDLLDAGQHAEALRHLRGTEHLDGCAPFVCQDDCPAIMQRRHEEDCSEEAGCSEECRIRRDSEKPTDPAGHFYSVAAPFTHSVDFINVWTIAQAHLAALAREHPQRLAFIGSHTEADDVLSLLSMHFSVPVVSNDLDFAVFGFGQMKPSSLFRRQFRLVDEAGSPKFLLLGEKGPSAGRVPVVEEEPGLSADVPCAATRPAISRVMRNKTLHSRTLKSILGVQYSSQMAWLPLIMGGDHGPPDGRLWTLVKSFFPEEDHQVRRYFERVSECYDDPARPWPKGASGFRHDWCRTFREATSSLAVVRDLLRVLPAPGDLLDFLCDPGRDLPGLQPDMRKAMHDNKALLSPLEGALRRSSGPGALLLRRYGYYWRPRGRLEFKHIRDGIVFCLGVCNAGSKPQMHLYCQRNFADSLHRFLDAECQLLAGNPWCLYASSPPPSTPWNWKSSPLAGPREPQQPGQPARPGQPAGREARAAAPPARGPDGESHAEEGSAAGPGTAPPACRCQYGAYLLQGLLLEPFHSPLLVQGLCMAYAKTRGPWIPEVVHIFKKDLHNNQATRLASMPPLPQVDPWPWGGETVWARLRHARLLMYTMLAAGPLGKPNDILFRRAIENHPLAQVDWTRDLATAKAFEYRLDKFLDGEIGHLLHVVDSALQGDQDRGFDRVLLATILLASRPPATNFQQHDFKGVFDTLLGLCSFATRPVVKAAIQSLNLPRDINYHSLAALVPKDAGDRGSFVAFAHSVLDWCLIQMKTKASAGIF